MRCQSSSRRRRPLRPNPARHRARGETWCVKPKRNPTCRSVTPSRRSPHKSRLESDDSLTNLAPRYVSGQQYSITALTDSSGTIKERYAYDAYGGLSVFDGSGTARASTADGNRYTHTGRAWDEDLELYQFRARMYAPVAGRFVGRDPISYRGGPTLYSYVGDRPLTFNDASGLYACKVSTAVPPELNDNTNMTIVCYNGKMREQIVSPRLHYKPPCLLDCIREHERVHIAQYNSFCPGLCNHCQKKDTIYWVSIGRPIAGSNVGYYECLAYQVHLRCLEEKFEDAGCPLDRLIFEIDRVKQRMKDLDCERFPRRLPPTGGAQPPSPPYGEPDGEPEHIGEGDEEEIIVPYRPSNQWTR